MKERNIVLIIVFILAILGIAVCYFSLIDSDFNFHKSKISLNGKTVKEELSYQPNRAYHTLYRNFISPIFLNNNGVNNPINSIGINSVSCQEGTAYIKIYNTCYNFPEKIKVNCLPYTEDNEYGCTFGNTLGFKKSSEYLIESEYEVYPQNLFKINGKYYIKFIVYSRNNHKLLITGKNFIISKNAISKKYYFPGDDVIIYLPYDKIGQFTIIEQNDFLFDTNYFPKIILLLAALFPSILFFLIWLFFGKELIDPDLPSELSMAPNDRKAWEVAAFFNPPFAELDKNFFSSLLLDFYNRKIIDLKLISEEMYVKINNTPKDLDAIEQKFISLLIKANNNTINEYRRDGYFNLDKTMKSALVRVEIENEYKSINSKIKKEKKKYIDKSPLGISFIIFFAIFIITITLESLFLIGFYVLYVIFLTILNMKSTILIRFKEDYYKEYLHWQAFKKYLSYSYTIKSATHKTVIMWEEYLIYATALGVPKRVLKEGKKIKIINPRRQEIYAGVYIHSTPIVTGYVTATAPSGGSGGFGGGFGGAGGGGVGGGGGGGR